MKILLTSDWDLTAVNGVATSVAALRQELLRQGHEVRVLTLSGSLQTVWRHGVYAVGSVDAGRIYPGARLRAAAAGETVRALIDWRPDVVHSNCEFSTFFLARRIARACGAPLLHTYHTVYEDYTHYFSPSRSWGRRMARLFTCAVTARTDGVIAPTRKVAALLEGYGVRCPVRVIPTGIDLRRFAAPPPEGWVKQTRAALGIPQGNRVMLFLGRLAREKNVDELLRCRLLLGETPVTLLLVGGGPEEAALRRKAAELPLGQGAVAFAGAVEPAQAPLYYRLGDAFVSASGSETQGLTYLEALAAGLPAVCRADPCLEGVLQNGVNGWQCPDAAAMAQRLGELFANEPLRAAMANRAAASAQAFSVQAFGRAAVEFYADAIAQKHLAPVWQGRASQWQMV